MYKKIIDVNNNLEVFKRIELIRFHENLQRYLFVGVLALVFVAFFYLT